ncbi:hypothetical protein [Cysteiniphilum marinum]|uniref:hypothetical protein n=1 Tax=Cysteiniphilum marinum TaxID=2774191 RepID=UPI001939D19E|nr:hypothetical protein [Cysteiniphilum marinum]
MKMRKITPLKIALAATLSAVAYFGFENEAKAFIDGQSVSLLVVLFVFVAVGFFALAVLLNNYSKVEFNNVKGAIDSARLFTLPLDLLACAVLSFVSLILDQLVGLSMGILSIFLLLVSVIKLFEMISVFKIAFVDLAISSRQNLVRKRG